MLFNVVFCFIFVLFVLSIMFNIILFVNLKDYSKWLDDYLKSYVLRSDYIYLDRKYYYLKIKYESLLKKYLDVVSNDKVKK